MLRQSLNQVVIKGKLEEIDLENKTDKNGREYIRGVVTLLVNQTVEGIGEQEHIQVNVFSYKITNKGTENPAYKSAFDLMKNGVSIAAAGSEEGADSYTVTGASLATNTFENKDKKDITYTFIRGSFFNKNTKVTDDEASFEQEIIVASIEDEVVNDTPTGRLILQGICIGYNEVPDKFVYVVENPNAINYIRTNYQEEDTVKISGVIRMTSVTEEAESEEEVGFGTPKQKTYDRTIKEFIITAGSPGRLPEEKSYDIDEVRAAITKKKNDYAEKKAARETANVGSSRAKIRGF